MTDRGAHPGLKYEYPLPHWADKNLHGEVELYAQLQTRDGRRFGNGIVVEVIEASESFPASTYYVVLSDFGNRLMLSADRLAEQFYPPIFRMKKHLAEFRAGAMDAYLEIERTLKTDAG